MGQKERQVRRQTYRTEWKSLLEKMKKMYRIVRQCTHSRKLVPEMVPLWLKNRNQRIHMGGLMRGWLIWGEE